jgi:hypothetical protein
VSDLEPVCLFQGYIIALEVAAVSKPFRHSRVSAEGELKLIHFSLSTSLAILTTTLCFCLYHHA